MNMNKKIMLIIITFFSFCIFSLDVFADNSCKSINDAATCKKNKNCEWKPVNVLSEKNFCYYSGKGSPTSSEQSDCNAAGYSKNACLKYKHCSFTESCKLKKSNSNSSDNSNSSSSSDNSGNSNSSSGSDNSDNSNNSNSSDNSNNSDNSNSSGNLSGTNSTIQEWKEKECSDITDSKTCSDRQDCVYTGGTCQDAFVASNPCEEDSVKRTLKFFGFLLLIAKYMVPLIIIGFASFDLYKAVVDKDEKSLNKQLRMIIIRIVSGIVVFLLPNIVYAIMGLSDKTDIKDNQDYSMCAKCLLKTSECEISSESDNERTCSSNLTQSECENRDYIWDGQCCRIPTCSTLMLPDECRRRGYNYDTDNKCCKMPSIDGSTSSSTHISSSGRVHGGIGGSY